MAYSEDQWNTSDKSKILSEPDDSSLESFDLATPKRPSYYEPTEDCLPYIPDDPICVPTKTPNPNHGEQPNQPISPYDQVNDQALINIQSDDTHINQPPPAYSPPSLDYRSYDRIPHAHNDLPSAPPTSSHYGGPVDQRQYDNTYPNPQPYNLKQQSQAIQQHQPQVIYVGYQPPMVPVNVDNSDLMCSIVGAIVLSVFSLPFYVVFGVFAIILARRAYQAAKNGDRTGAIKWRNTSYGLSIAGIIIGGAVTGIYIYVQSQRWNRY